MTLVDSGSTHIVLNMYLVQEEESIQPWSIVGQLVKGAYLSSYHLNTLFLGWLDQST